MFGYRMPERPAPEPTPPASTAVWSARRLVGYGAVALLVLAVLAAAAGLLAYHSVEDEWPWSTYPTTLHACGRDFVPEGAPETRAEVTNGGYHLVRMAGDLQGWFNHGSLWTFDTVRAQPSQALPGGCHVLMWVRDSAGAYQPYVLSGGP